VVECIEDHVRILDDLPNGATLAQEMIAGSVLLITKILAIENDKLHNTFLPCRLRVTKPVKANM
jgi:hypothetical protein